MTLMGVTTRDALAFFAGKLAPTGVTQGAIRALFYVLKSEFLQGPTLSPQRSLEDARFLGGTRESINTIYFNDFYVPG